MKFNRRAIRMALPVFLTQFAFGRKIYYICNSQAGLPTWRSRFSCVFQRYWRNKTLYFLRKVPVLQFKFQVFELKFRYGLFRFRY